MSLSIKSNQASNIALRTLNQTDRAMTASLSKLASGSRVQSAKDDTAALAIGSRLKAELSALKTVSSNATQGIAMLQIAEGAYARATDMTIRLRALATQAASSSLSNTERGMLDTEFQAIKDELDRMAAGTTFNGNQLLNSSFNYVWDPTYYLGPPGQILDFTMYNTAAMTGYDMYVYNNGGGDIYFINNITGRTYGFDFNTSPYFDTNTGLTTQITTISINEIENGLPTGAVVGSITVNSGFDVVSWINASTDPALRVTSSSYSSQSYRISTGSTNSSISASLFGLTTTNLGLSSASLTSIARAQSAAEAARFAVDLIARSRSEIAASQNRMESAQKNNATTTENLELARSAYLDLDVAAEMSVFTSKQVLVQAGVSMLAQANQVPKNLLRLFG